MYNLRNLLQNNVGTKTKQHPVKQIIHNISSYVLSRVEEIALSNGLGQHIPSSLSKTVTDAEFEQFYQGLLKDIPYQKKESRHKISTVKISSLAK